MVLLVDVVAVAIVDVSQRAFVTEVHDRVFVWPASSLELSSTEVVGDTSIAVYSVDRAHTSARQPSVPKYQAASKVS